jgi:ABC-type branched-subunit amino acid transport system substrate-binding protein
MIVVLTTIAALWAVEAFSASPFSSLTAQEKRGRRIYLKGTSEAGRDILAYVGKGAIEAPASAMPCVNCHSRTGEGLVESGIAATDINWQELTKVYGLSRIRGRDHPAYTVESLARAISRGIDPGGNELDVSMPRYKMSDEDLVDLIAFMKRLGTIMDPGVSEGFLDIATMLPLSGRHRELGHAVQGTMEAYLRELNDQGGVFGRKIRLRVLEYGEDGKAGLDGMKRLMAEEGTFALVAPLISGVDAEVIQWVEDEEIPLIGPMTARTESASPLNRYSFFIFSGLREQVQALMAFLAAERPGVALDRLCVVGPESDLSSQLADAAGERLAGKGWNPPERLFYDSRGVAGVTADGRLRKGHHRAVLFLGTGEDLLILLKEWGRNGDPVVVLCLGSQIRVDPRQIPSEFRGEVLLAYPTLPADRSDRGKMRLGRLLESHKVKQGHLPAQISAYAALELFVEGLKRSGRELTREKLVSILERVYELDTGVTPRLTFEPNRRVGALGAHVVAMDPGKGTFVPEAHWVPLE